MEKCFILCRQSSGEGEAEESLSLAVQEEECIKLAASRGLIVVESFKEANTSGRLFPTGYESIAAQDLVYTAWCRETKKFGQWRRELGELLKRLEEVQYIVCYDLTRFFRPLNGSFLGSLLTQLLQAKGVKLLTVKEGVLDFARFQDSLISSLTSQINSEQLRTQTEKSKAAYKRLRDNGEYYPSLSMVRGYRKTGKKLEVEVVPREAEMVKLVFKLYNAAVPVGEIMREVNDRFSDILKKPCSRGVLMKLLASPAYCGYQRSSTGELVKSKQLAGKEIVTVEEWMQVREKLEAQKTHIKRPKKSWTPLAGYVYCGACGAKMKLTAGGGKQKSGSAFLFCFEHLKIKGKKSCGTTILHTAEKPEGNGLIETVKPLLLAEAMKLMHVEDEDKEARKKVAQLSLQLAEVKKKAKKLTELWMDSMLDEGIYETSMKSIKAKENELLKEKNSLEMTLDRDTSTFDWVKLMMKFRGDSLSRGEYEQLLRGMLKKVVVYGSHVEVHTTYGSISIPRQKLGRYTLCYNYCLWMKHGKAALLFYSGRAAAKVEADIEKAEWIGKLGELEVFCLN